VRYQAALRPDFWDFNDFHFKMTASEGDSFLKRGYYRLEFCNDGFELGV